MFKKYKKPRKPECPCCFSQDLSQETIQFERWSYYDRAWVWLTGRVCNLCGFIMQVR